MTEESKTPENEHEDLAALVDKKMPLIVADYRSYFDAGSRLYQLQASLRNWEVSTLVAVTVLIANLKSDPQPILLLPLICIIGLFWVLDAGMAALRSTLEDRVVEVESRLDQKNNKDFCIAIRDWEFGNTHYRSHQDRRRLYYRTLRLAVREHLIAFHLGLAVIITTLFFFGTSG